MYLGSCFDNLYGASVSYYHNCIKYNDSTVYQIREVVLENKNRDNSFFSNKNKIYLVEYKFDLKHLKLVSEYKNTKQVIWFRYIGNQKPDWICKNK